MARLRSENSTQFGPAATARLPAGAPARLCRNSADRFEELFERIEDAILERDDAVEAARQFEIVGRDQRGESAGADDPDQHLRDAGRSGVVEIAGRLVGQQDL